MPNAARRKLVTPRKPRRRRVPQARPKGIQMAYYGALRKSVTQPAHSLVKRLIVPELASLVAEHADFRMDAAPKKVNKLVAKVSTAFFAGLPPDNMEAIAARYADATSDLQRRELARQLKDAVSVAVPIDDARLGPAIEHFTSTNVSLIRTIPERYFSQVEQVVLQGVGDGDRWESIAERLEERYSVSEGVAKVIARDQVGKFYANLNETRQTNLGITHFYWQTADDERTCEICFPLNGKRFAWDNPPEEGLPGEVHPQCGCSADPDTDDLVDRLEGGDDAETEPAPDEESDNQDRADAEWNEEDHPRDEHGRFGDGGGGGGAAKSVAISILRDAGGLSEAIEAANGFEGEAMDPETGAPVPITDVRNHLEAMRPAPIPSGKEMITVHHSTDEKTAALMLRDGFIPELKGETLASSRFAAGETANFGPGAGLSGGMYVGAEGATGSYGRVTLALRVPVSYLQTSPEQATLGVANPLESLGTHDGAVITKSIPPGAINRIDFDPDR